MPNIDNASIVSMRRDRKGFKLEDDNWYSSFNPISNINVGDVVSFEYLPKGNFNNIKGSVEVTGGAVSAPASSGGNSNTGGNKGYNKRGGFPVAIDDMGRAINRQSAIAQAVNAMKQLHTETNLHKMTVDTYQEKVILLARYFEAYTTGDLDTEIGKQLAAEAAQAENKES
jgi:hypothetical protein